jgi:hypothetical protein
MTTRVERIKSVHAILPICFVFGSGDLKYFMPGHLVIKIKQINGRMILKAYIHACVCTVVESGASFNFAPQFGQK